MNGALLTLGGVSALAAASAWSSKEPQRISPVVILSRWGGTRPSYHQTLIDFGRAAADRYRSSTQKSSSWLPAGNEYHYWSHGKDRYLAVWNRVNALLTDPSLSDEPLPSGP